MEPKMNVYKLVPKAYEILIEMEKFLATTDLDHKLKDLLKIRASQINKCAYCLEMHTLDAEKAGETTLRIYALPAWQESPHFTDQERAALQFTEEMTRLSKNGVKDETFDNLKKHFSEKQIAEIIILLGQINFWNRINVPTHQIYTPESH